MVTKKTTTDDGNLPDPAQTVPEFTKAQIELVNKMLEERLSAAMSGMQKNTSPNSPISLYELRDPKEIQTVKVSRFDAKWVLGFKNLQKDPYKKFPQYNRYGVDPIRKLNREPYITLFLSIDGKEIEEREVLHVDYMEHRDREDVKVVKCVEKVVIHDHGILGSVNNFAVAIDDKGKVENRPTIAAQSKTIERVFTVQLPEFEGTTDFITDFLG